MRQADNLITGIKASPRTGTRHSPMLGCGVCGYPWSTGHGCRGSWALPYA